MGQSVGDSGSTIDDLTSNDNNIILTNASIGSVLEP